MNTESNRSQRLPARASVSTFPLVGAFCLGVVLSAGAQEHAQARAEALFQRKLLLGLMILLVVIAAVYLYSRKKV